MSDYFSARRKSDLFREGVAHFNARRFFEAHESWEVIWLRAPEPVKTFLQGITQITAAFHHHRRGNFKGRESLLRKGLAKLERFAPDSYGIHVDLLRRAIVRWLQLARRRKRHHAPRLPKIWFVQRTKPGASGRKENAAGGKACRKS
jgi:predicted metal-dependent hydrolase